MNFKRTIPYLITTSAMLFSFVTKAGSSDKPIQDFESKIMKKQLMKTPDIKSDTTTLNLTQAIIDMTVQNSGIVYTKANGEQVLRSGGSIAWRNNNPGCLRYSKFTISKGAIGKAYGFAVFPDEETGMRAIAALLQSNSYKDLSIAEAIFRYAPPHENDTENYKKHLEKMTGLTADKKICTLTNAELSKVVQAIRKVEGWRQGTEVQITPVKPKSFHDFDNVYAYTRFNNLQKTL